MKVPEHVGVIAETIALAEAQLGYIPEGKVVAQGLTAHVGGTVAGKLTPGPLAAADAADVAGPHAEAVARRFGQVMEGCDVVVIACYAMKEPDALAASHAIRVECPAQAAKIRVDARGFKELPGPAPWWPRSVIEQTRWAASRAAAGRVVVPQSELTPIPDLTGPELAVIQSARDLDPANGDPAAALRGAIAAFQSVQAGQAQVDDPRMIAAVLGGLEDSDSRDVLIIQAISASSDLARQMANGQADQSQVKDVFSSVIIGTSRPPDPPDLDRGLALFARAGAASQGHLAANAFSVNAFACFAAGDRARAEAWLTHAEAADPSSKLPGLLRNSIRIGLGPAPAWLQTPPEEPGPKVRHL